MQSEKKDSSKKKLRLLLLVVLLLIVAILGFMLYKNSTKPSLSIQPTVSEVSSVNRDEILLNVILSDMPDAQYPAASLSIDFDKNKLEFLGVKQGTMMAKENEDSLFIPEWNVNTEVSNQKGQINAMYVDMSAGDNAYVPAGFAKDKQDIVLRLSFKLRDSNIAGDKHKLEFADAVFATVSGDEDGTSLSMTAKSLNVKGSEIKVS